MRLRRCQAAPLYYEASSSLAPPAQLRLRRCQAAPSYYEASSSLAPPAQLPRTRARLSYAALRRLLLTALEWLRARATYAALCWSAGSDVEPPTALEWLRARATYAALCWSAGSVVEPLAAAVSSVAAALERRVGGSLVRGIEITRTTSAVAPASVPGRSLVLRGIELTRTTSAVAPASVPGRSLVLRGIELTRTTSAVAANASTTELRGITSAASDGT